MLSGQSQLEYLMRLHAEWNRDIHAVECEKVLRENARGTRNEK